MIQIGIVSDKEEDALLKVIGKYFDCIKKKYKIYYFKKAFSKDIVDANYTYEFIYSLDYFESADFIKSNENLDFLIVKIDSNNLIQEKHLTSMNLLDYVFYDFEASDFQILMNKMSQNENQKFHNLNLLASNLEVVLNSKYIKTMDNMNELINKKNKIKTNLITKKQIISLEHSAKILKTLNIFNTKKFSKTVRLIKNINSKEFIVKRKRCLVFDKTRPSIDQSIKEIMSSIKSTRFKVLIYGEHSNEDVVKLENYDYRVLMESCEIYLDLEYIDFAKEFIKNYLDGRGNNLRLINQDKKNIEHIFKKLRRKEVLIVFTKNFEMYEKIKGVLT